MATTTTTRAAGMDGRQLVLPERTEQPVVDADPKDEHLAGHGMDLGKESAARLLRYGNVFPFVGGAFVAMYGAKEVKGATPQEQRDGVVDLARGGTSLAGSLAHLPMYFSHYIPGLFSLSHPTMHILGFAGGIAGTLQTLIDGVRDVGNGIKDHSSSDIGWGLAKVALGGAEAYASFTVNVPLMLALNVAYGAVAAAQNHTAVANACRGIGHKVSHALHLS